jgi:hypothetical protein
VAIRHRSRSANHRAGARAPATTGDPPGTSKATVPMHRPPSTSSRPAAAVTGAVSRYLMELNGWSSPQMLERYGGSVRGARARRHYDLIMKD